jgi:hypothetical protein
MTHMFYIVYSMLYNRVQIHESNKYYQSLNLAPCFFF